VFYVLYLAHKTSLTPSLFIEVPVPSQESEQSYFCELGVSILPLSKIFLLEFGTVLTGIYCFSDVTERIFKIGSMEPGAMLYEANREFMVSYSQIRYEVNREFMVSYSQIRYEANREFMVSYSQIRYEANMEFMVSYSQIRYEANREFMVSYNQIRNEANREFMVS
jgi:hypothetical protein